MSGDSSTPVITPDGRYIVFASTASSLVSGDTNGSMDIFRCDLLNNDVIEVVSASSGGAIGNADSLTPQVSDDGRFIVFESVATTSNDRLCMLPADKPYDCNSAAGISIWFRAAKYQLP